MRSTCVCIVHFFCKYCEAVLLVVVFCSCIGTGRDLSCYNAPFSGFFLGAHPFEEFYTCFFVFCACADTKVLAADRGAGCSLITSWKETEIIVKAGNGIGLCQMPGTDFSHSSLSGCKLIKYVRLVPVDTFFAHGAVVYHVCKSGKTGHCGFSGKVAYICTLCAVLCAAQPRKDLEGSFLCGDTAHCEAVSLGIGICAGFSHFLKFSQAGGHMVIAGCLKSVHVASQS